MNIYETIISILDEKGPLSIPLICQEVNELLVSNKHNPVLPAHIQAIVTGKKDVFRVRKGNICIAPDKYPFSLLAILESEEGITYQLSVNFTKKSFYFFEWRDKRNQNDSGREPYLRKPGNVDEFKREIIALKIWNWQSTYGSEEGITLGKTNWTIKLKTKNKTYLSEGIDLFPEEWSEFCKSVEKLTGEPFVI